MKVRLGILIVFLLTVWGCSQGVKPETKQSYTFTFRNEWINVELTNRLKGVYIGGSFNGWKYKTSPLAYSNGVWTTVVPLAPGEYLYKLVCVFDGIWEDQWIHDFGNPDIRINEFGSFNSALVIDKDGSVSPVKIYDIKESAHFKFFYKPDDFKTNSIDDYIAETEKSAERLAAFLKVKFPPKLNVYIECKPGPSWDINVFRSMILYYAPHNQNLVIHELTHLLVYSYKSLAMSEGLATYCSLSLYPYERSGTVYAVPVELYIASFVKSGITNTIDYYMTHPKEFWWTENPLTGVPYTFMEGINEYLAKKYGMDSVVRVFGNGFDFQSVYKKSMAELDKEWKASLAAKKFTEDEQLIIESLSENAGFLYLFSTKSKKNKELVKETLIKISRSYSEKFFKLIASKNNIPVIADKTLYKEQIALMKKEIADAIAK